MGLDGTVVDKCPATCADDAPCPSKSTRKSLEEIVTRYYCTNDDTSSDLQKSDYDTACSAAPLSAGPDLVNKHNTYCADIGIRSLPYGVAGISRWHGAY